MRHRDLENDGALYGGMDEDTAHAEIYAALKEINPKAKIKTEWTYMEELPFNSYGDRTDGN